METEEDHCQRRLTNRGVKEVKEQDDTLGCSGGFQPIQG